MERCTNQVVILNGVCGVKNPAILRYAQNDRWALCTNSLTENYFVGARPVGDFQVLVIKGVRQSCKN
jgi:hypothetical protein